MWMSTRFAIFRFFVFGTRDINSLERKMTKTLPKT